MTAGSWREWAAKHPERQRASNERSRLANKPQARARGRARYWADVEKTREYDRARYAAGRKPRTKWHAIWDRYRLRRSDYEAILDRQGNVCAICQRSFPSEKGTHVDHDHECAHEGRGRFSCADCVRGILCAYCNTTLKALEDPDWLHAAVKYLGSDLVAEILSEGRLW